MFQDKGRCPYCGAILEIGLFDYGKGRCGDCGGKILVQPNRKVRRILGQIVRQISIFLPVLVQFEDELEGVERDRLDDCIQELIKWRLLLQLLLSAPN